MKLNYKRTLAAGFAFFLICAFWQAYDNIIPKILTDKFGMPHVWSGAVMALDNVLAVFLLPIFGAVSDRHFGKLGRRTPFILFGTVAAAAGLVVLSIVDNIQLAHLGEYGSPAETTAANPWILVLFMGILMIVLVSMSIFRSPAVALMPDITPKPLRSKANAVINLMGSAGGILVLALGIVFGTGKPENATMSYTVFFSVIAGLMLAALVIFLLTVREKKWAAEAEKINDALDAETKKSPEKESNDAKTGENAAKTQKNAENSANAPKNGGNSAKSGLSRGEMKSLILILASVVLWYMGYNAVTSKYSVYAGDVLGLDYNLTLIVAQAAAIVSYIPVGIISSKLGRRKTILAGVCMLGAAFLAAAFINKGSSVIVMNLLFALAGIGWATINVNSYPMVVELAGSGDVGKYTGYYYTASMSAQIITPILSGAFLTYGGMRTLFPYAAIFVAGSFVTMLFVRHGDSKGEKKALLEHLDVGD